MSTFAKGTTVSAEKSRSEIESLLLKMGATSFGSMTDMTKKSVMIGFVFAKLNIRMEIPIPAPEDELFFQDGRGCRRNEVRAHEFYDGEVRRRWRCLCLAIKAKMIAVSDGVTTFEREFMPYIVTDDGRTVSERMLPAIESARKSGEQISCGFRVSSLPALPGKVG